MNQQRQPSATHRPARISPAAAGQPTPVHYPHAAINQVRRTMQLFCLLLTLLVAVPVWAGEFYLNDLGFGDRPAPDMLCTDGSCLTSGQTRVSLPIASYTLSRDWTHFEATPITTPHYDFLNDQLFRIRFRLDCRPAKAEESIQHFWNAFKLRYPLVESPCHGNLHAAVCRRGTAASGEVVSVSWWPQPNTDSQPQVQIFDPYLMDEARSLANPDYQPRY